MDEYVIVVFDDDGRQVLVGGRPAGLTNRLFHVPTGRHTFTLAGDQDYVPSSQTVWVRRTRREQPCVVVFVKQARVNEMVAASAGEDT